MHARMYVCMYVCVGANVCMHACVCMYANVYDACTHAYMHACVCMHANVYDAYTHAYMHACVYARVCMHACVRTYVYVYVCTDTKKITAGSGRLTATPKIRLCLNVLVQRLDCVRRHEIHWILDIVISSA
jgi:hypothetical protein